jgi:hypothetical protein
MPQLWQEFALQKHVAAAGFVWCAAGFFLA